MMFPVNRKATELTVAELLNLYDQSVSEAKLRATSPDHPTVSTVAELRAEIERRMAPCNRQHFHPLQTSGYMQSLALQSLQNDPGFGLGQGNR